MILDLDDEAQFPLYYNIYEWKDTPTEISLAQGSETILDIGGNIGQMALLFSAYADNIYTFEPIPAVGDRLEKNIRLNHLENRVILSRIALTNFKGKIKFGLPPESNRGTGSTILTESSKSNTIEVDAITLDEFIEQNRIQNIDLIKMDIEGAELFALQGMKNLLSAPKKPIMILEMTLAMMKQAGYGPKELMSFLKDYGYSCFEFTKGGLKGPLQEVHPLSENYCFLTPDHLKMENVMKVLH